MRHVAAPAAHASPSASTAGDYHVEAACCAAPTARRSSPVDDLPADASPRPRPTRWPRSATALAAGATLEGVPPGAARRSAAPPHRVELVGELERRPLVRRLEGDHASAPVAALPVVRVGRADRRRAEQGPRPSVLGRRRPIALRGVVAIGEAADEIVAAFAGVATVATADIDGRRGRAPPAGSPSPATPSLLSPACASFDWYRCYGERGDDFAAAVRALARARRHMTEPGPHPAPSCERSSASPTPRRRSVRAVA